MIQPNATNAAALCHKYPLRVSSSCERERIEAPIRRKIAELQLSVPHGLSANVGELRRHITLIFFPMQQSMYDVVCSQFPSRVEGRVGKMHQEWSASHSISSHHLTVWVWTIIISVMDCSKLADHFLPSCCCVAAIVSPRRVYKLRLTSSQLCPSSQQHQV